MHLRFVIERPFQLRGSFHRSSISTRLMWGWLAVTYVKVDEHTYATTAYDWVERNER